MNTPSSILPYLTEGLPGIGGCIKQRVEDFRVDEIPLYPASGDGTHLYIRIEKRGIPTPVAVKRLATFLGCHTDQIGVAGLKDAQAISTQTLSAEHIDEAKLAKFHDAQMRILDISRHTNKLRTGHLAGNRFTIRIREVQPEQLPAAQAILDILIRRGVPNYFGPQRFGARGDTARLGRALLREQNEEFLAIFLGRPQSGDPPDLKAARDAFDAGQLDRALKQWPRHFADQRKALSAYKKKHKPGPAIAAIDKRLRRLFISAFQSSVFNAVLSRRIKTLDKFLAGDIAKKTDTGGLFHVEHPTEEQARIDAFEISPTGPLPGQKVMSTTEQAGDIEQAVFKEFHVEDMSLGQLPGGLKLKGARRALRFPLKDAGLSAGDDEYGPYIQLTFSAPSGCYATVLIEEICKNRQPYDSL